MVIAMAPERVEGLWFEDGSMVFQAEQSLYRLHPGILSACSPFFRDMLGVPQPIGSENYEGLPLVQMPDAASDATPFFEAIFRPASSLICLPDDADISIDEITAILRLSTKYNVDYLRFHALRHLGSRLPRSKKGYSSRNSWMSSKDALQLIPSLRTCNALWLLPAVYYLCAYISPALTNVSTLLEESNPPLVHISEERRIWNGHAKLSSSYRSRVERSAWFYECGMEDCSGLSALGAQHLGTHFDIFASLEGEVDLEDGRCFNCIQDYTVDVARFTEEAWNLLPSFFGLSAWDVLTDMEKTEMQAVYRPVQRASGSV